MTLTGVYDATSDRASASASVARFSMRAIVGPSDSGAFAAIELARCAVITSPVRDWAIVSWISRATRARSSVMPACRSSRETSSCASRSSVSSLSRSMPYCWIRVIHRPMAMVKARASTAPTTEETQSPVPKPEARPNAIARTAERMIAGRRPDDSTQRSG